MNEAAPTAKSADLKTTLALAVVFVAPRIARMIYPKLHTEDAAYLDIIASLSRGLAPHTDFVHTHFVFPEILVSAFVGLFGSAIRAAEFTTALAVIATSALVYVVAKKLFSARAAVVASVVFALHPMFVQYHLFEKETYEALVASLAALLLWKDAGRGMKKMCLMAVLFTIGFACKIDFAAFAGMMCLYLLAVEKRVKEAFALGAMFTLGVSAITFAVYSMSGEEALKQIYLFHFFKGMESGAGSKFVKFFVAAGPALVATIAAIPLRNRIDRAKLLFPYFWLAGPMLFFLVVTDTFWAHNIIPLLPPVCVLAGVFVDEAMKSFSSRTKCGLSKAWIIGVAVVTLAIGLPWTMFMSKFGFGFMGVPRVTISRVADKVSESSTESDLIIAPPMISAEANRTDLVHNREVYPVYVHAMTELSQKGFAAARRESSSAHFREVYEKTQSYWIDQAWWSIESGRAAVVVGYKGSDYQPFSPDPARMTNAGYEEIYNEGDFTVWLSKRSP